MSKITVLTRFAGRQLAVLAVLGASTMFAHADLIGDSVDGAIVGGPGAFKVVPPSNVVGAGVEFVIEFVGRPAFEVDIGAASMKVYSVFGARISTGAGEVLVLSDLDWVGNPGRIVGITNFQTNEGPDITIDDVTFTDDEVRLRMSPTIWEPDGFVSWDLVVEHDCVPCDANCDGSVDLTDIEPFIGLLFGDDPCAKGCSGDTNGDGSVDLTDIEGFIECLLG